MQPIYSFRMASLSDAIQILVFAVAAVLINALNQAKRRAEDAHMKLMQQQVDAAVKEVKMLEGLLPICSWCKKIRNDGRWTQLEVYISDHFDAEFTHTICPECRHNAEEGLGIQ